MKYMWMMYLHYISIHRMDFWQWRTGRVSFAKLWQPCRIWCKRWRHRCTKPTRRAWRSTCAPTSNIYIYIYIIYIYIPHTYIYLHIYNIYMYVYNIYIYIPKKCVSPNAWFIFRTCWSAGSRYGWYVHSWEDVAWYVNSWKFHRCG